MRNYCILNRILENTPSVTEFKATAAGNIPRKTIQEAKQMFKKVLLV